MIRLLLAILFSTASLSCQNSTTTRAQKVSQTSLIECKDHSCKGKYVGPEFIEGDDIAHQFSNTMSAVVGDKLKELYASGTYSEVDFKSIQMTTNGMSSGKVTYYLFIPFKRVSKKCDAYTSFDHVGGWDHSPALSQRKKQLNSLLLENEKLNISDLKTTPEGLEEYLIQWRHKEIQKDCT